MADKRTVNIHGKEYELVASRVERFRKEHEDWGIRTKLVEVTENRVIMKACIYQPIKVVVDEGSSSWERIDYHLIATGYAEEIRAANQINKTSALENCETSAIGRALACLGYIGGEYASADEVAGAIKQQGSQGGRPASVKQKNMLVNMYSDANGLPGDSTEKDVAEWAGTLGIDWNDLQHGDVQHLMGEIKEVKQVETNPMDPPEND